jgi:DNA-binding Lrp family transcriptional regulator
MAYVLLNTEIGAERDVLEKLKHREGVQEVFTVFGIYDVIARVKADSTDELTQIIGNLQVNKIHSKLTVIVAEP